MTYLQRFIVFLITGIGGLLMLGSITYTYAADPTCTSKDDSGCASACNTDTWKNTDACKQYAKLGKSDLLELVNIFDKILSIVYLLMRPILYVSSLAMDNSLIYGEGLGITDLLYQFWSLMRTIANFLMVLVLVTTVASSLWKGKVDTTGLMKTLGAMILGGVLINASWFLIGAMVDISTVATYGVGTIPLNLSSDKGYCDSKGNSTKPITSIDDVAKLGNCRPVLSTHSTFNLSNALSADNQQYEVYYSYVKGGSSQTDYFLACPFVNQARDPDAWKKLQTTFAQGGEINGSNNQKITVGGTSEVRSYFSQGGTAGSRYCVMGNQLLDTQGLEKGTKIGSAQFQSQLQQGMGEFHAWGGARIKNIAEAGRGMLGPLYTLYGNMLGFSTLKVSNSTDSAEGQLIQFGIKLFFGVAITFPLIALCIVLMMRVAVLWAVVGFAPLLVFGWTLEGMGIKNEYITSIMNSIGKKMTFSNVVALMFQPVLIVFTVSIGLMFVDALGSTLQSTGGFGGSLQCSTQTTTQGSAMQCCSLINTMNVCFDKTMGQSGSDAFFNYFLYSITNIIGIMVLWFTIFGVMKMSELSSSVTEKIKGIGENMLGSIPAIPWFDGSFVGVSGAKAGFDQINKKVFEEYKDTSGERITQPWVDRQFDFIEGKVSGAQNKIAGAADDFKDTLSDISSGRSLDDTKKYSDKLLEAISKQKESVSQATASELIGRNDPGLQALYSRYKVNNVKDLFTNPMFMAETGKSSDDLMKAYLPKNDKWQTYKTEEKKYKENLTKNIQDLKSLSSGSPVKYTTFNNKKYLFEVKDNNSLVNKNISIPSSNPTYQDLKPLSGVLTNADFTSLVGSSSGSDWKSKEDPATKLVVVEQLEVKKEPAKSEASEKKEPQSTTSTVPPKKN